MAASDFSLEAAEEQAPNEIGRVCSDAEKARDVKIFNLSGLPLDCIRKVLAYLPAPLLIRIGRTNKLLGALYRKEIRLRAIRKFVLTFLDAHPDAQSLATENIATTGHNRRSEEGHGSNQPDGSGYVLGVKPEGKESGAAISPTKVAKKRKTAIFSDTDCNECATVNGVAPENLLSGEVLATEFGNERTALRLSGMCCRDGANIRGNPSQPSRMAVCQGSRSEIDLRKDADSEMVISIDDALPQSTSDRGNGLEDSSSATGRKISSTNSQPEMYLSLEEAFPFLLEESDGRSCVAVPREQGVSESGFPKKPAVASKLPTPDDSLRDSLSANCPAASPSVHFPTERLPALPTLHGPENFVTDDQMEENVSENHIAQRVLKAPVEKSDTKLQVSVVAAETPAKASLIGPDDQEGKAEETQTAPLLPEQIIVTCEGGKFPHKRASARTRNSCDSLRPLAAQSLRSRALERCFEDFVALNAPWKPFAVQEVLPSSFSMKTPSADFWRINAEFDLLGHATGKNDDQFFRDDELSCENPLWSFAGKLEEELFQCTAGPRQYRQKLRELTYNLKVNTSVSRLLLLGSISISQVCQMSSEELATEDLLGRRKKALEDGKKAVLRLHPVNRCTANLTRMFECERCTHSEAYYYYWHRKPVVDRAQLKLICLNCHHKWDG